MQRRVYPERVTYARGQIQGSREVCVVRGGRGGAYAGTARRVHRRERDVRRASARVESHHNVNPGSVAFLFSFVVEVPCLLHSRFGALERKLGENTDSRRDERKR